MPWYSLIHAMNWMESCHEFGEFMPWIGEYHGMIPTSKSIKKSSKSNLIISILCFLRFISTFFSLILTQILDVLIFIDVFTLKLSI